MTAWQCLKHPPMLEVVGSLAMLEQHRMCYLLQNLDVGNSDLFFSLGPVQIPLPASKGWIEHVSWKPRVFIWWVGRSCSRIGGTSILTG
jgi:hypothetical protein